MGRRYEFPATVDEIRKCEDLATLMEWDRRFDLILNQIEDDFGGFANLTEGMSKFVNINLINHKKIKYRIKTMTSDVTPEAALKCFHDVVRDMMPEEYEVIVQHAKARLGKTRSVWEELIAKKKEKPWEKRKYTR